MRRARRSAGAPPEPEFEARRGDILWINCDPSLGVEPRKTRTCVVVSNDLANRFAAAISVVPTQRYTEERAARAYMVDLRPPRSTLTEDRLANVSMVMTYDRRRVVRMAGHISEAAEEAIDRALAVHLGLRESLLVSWSPYPTSCAHRQFVWPHLADP